MHIGIAVNHSYPFVGGCERVVQQVSEGLLKRHNCKCTIFSGSLQKAKINHNGIDIIKIAPSSRFFIKQLRSFKLDNIFVYSDLFKYWSDILDANLNTQKSIALVGMNGMRKNPRVFQRFCKQKDNIQVITHSNNYVDYLMCKKYDIPVNVIPNGVDFKEFNIEKGKFRDKYGIGSDKKIILCVSNFFPGKGQEIIPNILSRLNAEYSNFIFVMINAFVTFPLAGKFRNKVVNQCKSLNLESLFLQDIGRHDTISAFKDADVFLFPSQKEVAPLVILESMNSGTPWISLPVGNTPTLKGGIIINSQEKDVEDNFILNDEVVKKFSKNIKNLLINEDLNNYLSAEGMSVVKRQYNVDQVVDLYYKIFSKGR